MKKKRSGMTKYEKIKARILIFIAVLLVTQAVVSVGSFLHFKVTWDKMFPEEEARGYAHCIYRERLFSSGPLSE